MNTTKTLIALLALGVSVSAPAQSARAKGVQKAAITVDGGFKPASVNVKAGRPVQLTFDTKNRACIDSVVFSGLGLKRPLKNGTKTVVTFTPKKAGTYAFQCPMGMMKGSVVAK